MRVIVLEIKNLSIKEYLNEIKPYLKDIKINRQKSDTWKNQLTLVINFVSSKDVDEEGVMHSKSDNIEFTLYDNANEVLNGLFESLLLRYQIGLKTSVRGINFIFNSLKLLPYQYRKTNFTRLRSYIGSLDWIRKKKETINPKI